MVTFIPLFAYSILHASLYIYYTIVPSEVNYELIVKFTIYSGLVLLVFLLLIPPAVIVKIKRLKNANIKQVGKHS